MPATRHKHNLSPWQRSALQTLHDDPGYISTGRGKSWLGTGTLGLVKHGLAENFAPYKYRLTDEGRAEYARRCVPVICSECAVETGRGVAMPGYRDICRRCGLNEGPLT